MQPSAERSIEVCQIVTSDNEATQKEALPEPDDAVNGLLERIREGDEEAFGPLFELLYEELHRFARAAAADGRATPTLQPTALVNEAYMRIVKAGGPWTDRSHFLFAASKAMRHLLVDSYRAKRARKRDGIRLELDVEHMIDPYADRAQNLEALDAALDRLAEKDSTIAKAVELRFFGGLPTAEVAKLVGLPRRTLQRRLDAVRAWLFAELS